MGSAKQDVLRILEKLPEDVSLEDIQYHIYVVEKLERASRQMERGQTLSQEDVEGRMRKWLGE